MDSLSLAKLVAVDPRLRDVVLLAHKLSTVDFVVTEGLRSRERQADLFRAGATRTMNSKHLTGRAIDVAARVNGSIRWDWPLYFLIARAFKSASLQLNTPIVWGGDWVSFRDGPHFELAA